MKILSALVLGLVLNSTLTLAQSGNRGSVHTLSLKTQIAQIKDEFNYGLAHRGLNLAGEYSRISISDRNTYTYEAELSFGINYNKGLGMIWKLKPLDIFYGINLNQRSSTPVVIIS